MRVQRKRGLAVTLISRGMLFALSLTAMCGWHESPCGTENLLTIGRGARIEAFEIRDEKGSIIWKIEAKTPASLRDLKLGEVPSGFVQTIPSVGRPRDFLIGEKLSTFTVAADRSLLHEGYAKAPRSFCGGYYESTRRRT